MICRAIITAALRDLSLETGYLAVNLQGVWDTFCLVELSRFFFSLLNVYLQLFNVFCFSETNPNYPEDLYEGSYHVSSLCNFSKCLFIMK